MKIEINNWEQFQYDYDGLISNLGWLREQCESGINPDLTELKKRSNEMWGQSNSVTGEIFYPDGEQNL